VKVLVTSSRVPFALDLIRKLADAGHEVYASDTYATAPGSHSRYLAGHFVTPRPRQDSAAFIDEVERIVADEGIELVLPAFEEVFYLATRHDRLPLFSPPFATLARVHDKWSFQRVCEQLGVPAPRTTLASSDDELRSAIESYPRYFARAAFSRGGVGLLTNTGPLAGAASPADTHPTPAAPWLVQEFVDGPMICTYSVVHDGKLSAHLTYRAPRQWQHSFYSFLAFGHHERLSHKDHTKLLEAWADDIAWNGEPIPGLSDADAAALREIESAR